MNTEKHSRTPRRAWLGLLVLLGPVLLVSMDGSVLFLAMPQITASLAPSADQALWILDIYGFAVGSLLIAFGAIGDRYGRLRLLMVGTLVFGIGSTVAAFAPSAEILIAARALMGLAGATLLPSGLAVLSELFPDSRRRARAIGIFAATYAAGFAIGPVLGGVLLSSFWWGSVFLINLPVMVLFLAVAPTLLREVRTVRTGGVDVLSVLLSAAGMLAVVYAIKHAAAYGLSTSILGVVVIGIVLLGWFARRQGRLTYPLMDLSLFRERVFTVAIITALLSLFAWSATAYLTGVYLQSVLGLPVLVAGLLALPGAAVLTVTCVATPAVVARIGNRTALIACQFFMAAGLLLLLPTGLGGGAGWFVAGAVVAGVGYGISFSLVADIAVGAVPASRAGSAAALSETANEVGHALGIALLGSLATFVFRLGGPGVAGTLDETLDLPLLSEPVRTAAKAAFVDGLHVAAVTASVLCVLLGVLAWRWIPKNRRDQEPIEANVEPAAVR